MKILVVGGAGYIGSHMVKLLLEAGHETTVFDNLSHGHRDAVIGGELVEGDLADREGMKELFAGRRFDAVMHFASFIEVGESELEPLKYFRNNVANTLNLIDIMLDNGVGQLIYSSSAAVYGEPEYTPVDEAHPTAPVNPYGRSKLMVEQVLADCARSLGLKSVSLRYFNAAGADTKGRLGERHDPETHLVPLVLQAASGRRPSVSIFGDDYDTPDGTCVRDYVHVQDLCDAHLLALEYLGKGGETTCFNLGNGAGFTVRQVIDSARRVTGRDFPVAVESRRAGDPPVLVADSKAARSVLGWRPSRSGLERILETAWWWERTFSGGPDSRV